MLHIGDDERRRRIAVRHALSPAFRVSGSQAAGVGSPLAAARAMVALHATEPSTVHLSVHARSDDVTVADVEHALYVERSLVKQLAMRRTLFVFPREFLPSVWSSVAARVAEFERRKISKDIVAAGRTADPDQWLEAAAAAVLSVTSGTDGLSSKQIVERVPMLAGTVETAPGTKWGGATPIAPRVLTWIGAQAVLVRGPNATDWRASRPRWLPMAEWLATMPEPSDARAGYAELVRRWLDTFGPGTEDDLVWWLGSTKRTARQALQDIGAVAVSLNGGMHGWVLAGDDGPTEDVEPWAALLPTLDPTTMGWKQRGFYLDPGLAPYVFDSVGNGGTTAWWDGRIVGAWVQDDGGRVDVVTHEAVSLPGRRALRREADRLTDWLGGVRISNVYKSALMRGEPLP